MNNLRLLTGLLILTSYTVLTGCTAVTVKPIPADSLIEHICIQANPRVTIRDFVSVMQEGFTNHGITSQYVTGSLPSGCEYSATYTARRSWDLATYLTEAQIDVLRDGRQIASANYHMKGKGGLSPTKWAGTRSKILPVIDELFAQVPRREYVPRASTAAAATAVTPEPTTAKTPPALSEKLSTLKDAYDVGLITKDEYETKRKALISGF